MHPKLLEIIVCPVCKGPLRYERDLLRLVCERCKLVYPVSDKGVPALISEDAEPLDEDGLD